MRAGIASQLLPADVSLAFLPPGKEFERFFLSPPAGASLPGWRLALSLNDQRLFESAAAQRIASYVWIGVLVVVTVIVLAALALRLVRRQMALTQLRNDLVANVTHELKTPLSSMRLLVDTLLNSQPLHEQTAREYLQLIAQENLRLSRLIDNFLTFSRMERNKYAFGFKEVPAAAIVEGALTAVRERFNAPGCLFETHAAPDLPSVVADADAMVTALVNLLDNAYKYSGEEKQITLSASAENGSVFFAVKDNGIGLTPRDTKRIFKRFFQVDQRLSRSGGGCGLGLSIVKFIVTAHHGSVRVESQPGRGSTFTISLPADSHPNPETNP
jgi:signal transduction histidine kinase